MSSSGKTWRGAALRRRPSRVPNASVSSRENASSSRPASRRARGGAQHHTTE
ncbi:Uncharacterised protein [Bordetella pertussis]|nr:Uncharacterised protein [Bordetella pertussis]